jgi:hypothetical protein
LFDSRGQTDSHYIFYRLPSAVKEWQYYSFKKGNKNPTSQTLDETKRLGEVAHSCHSSYTEGGDYQEGSRQAQAKIHKILLPQIKSQMWWYAPVIPAMREA